MVGQVTNLGGAELLLIFLGWIVIWGGIGAAIASNKGISGGVGFLLGALLGLIGIIIVLIMKPSPAPGGVQGVPVAVRECPFCKSAIRRDASVCPYCQRESKPWQFYNGYWWSTDDSGANYWFDERRREWIRHEQV